MTIENNRTSQKEIDDILEKRAKLNYGEYNLEDEQKLYDEDIYNYLIDEVR